MDRINHVKIVTPEPEAVDTFLREVLDIPKGWELGGDNTASDFPAAPERKMSWGNVLKIRGDDGSGGCITGDEKSRQFQVLRGEKAHIWSVAVGTRNLEQAHSRCEERGIRCSDMQLVPWGDDQGIRAFFAEVGGIVFEVMRVEAK